MFSGDIGLGFGEQRCQGVGEGPHGGVDRHDIVAYAQQARAFGGVGEA
jgi:hypothetical protein